MLNVNCSNLKGLISELEKNIEEVENDELNLFQNLHNSCISWQDGNSLLFKDYIDEEKRETETFFELLVNRENVFKEILSCYAQLGNKISCNINAYERNLYKVRNCISQCDSLLSLLNSVSYDVSSVKNTINSVKTALTEVEASISKKFKHVIESEKKLLSEIKNITDIVISEYKYQLIKTNYNERCTLELDDIDADMRHIDLYSAEEKKNIESLFSKFYEALVEYNSDNTDKLSSTLFELKNDSNYLTSKREKYLETLSLVKENYILSTDTVISMMRKGV